jgi:DnaK suppressor protein
MVNAMHEDLRKQMVERLAVLERRMQRISDDRRHSAIPLEKDFEEQATQCENDEVLDALDETGRSELEGE